MRLFRKKRKEKQESGSPEILEEVEDRGPGEQEEPLEETAVAGDTGPLEEPRVTEPEAGEQKDEAPADTRGFFDLEPGELAEHRPAGHKFAARRRRDYKPALMVMAALIVVGGVVALVVLLWPSSTVAVPDLVGMELGDAMERARAGGFTTNVAGWEYSEQQPDGVVLRQDPGGLEKAKKGITIEVTASKGPDPGLYENGIEVKPQARQEDGDAPLNPYAGRVVCLDPGHQALQSGDEWVDPGMKKRVPFGPGARGLLTGNPEHLVNLDTAVKLKSLLEKDGIEVVMTRDKSEVSISNIDRAEIANSAQADLCVRIHCGDDIETSTRGTRTLYPVKTEYTEDFYSASKTAALYVQAELVKSCDSIDLGTEAREDISGFNWSAVPVIQAEIGYLSNPEEDDLLTTDEYRWDVAWGLRNGIIQYLSGE